MAANRKKTGVALGAILVVIAVAAGWFALNGPGTTTTIAYGDLTAKQINQVMQNQREDLIVLDVRTPQEFQEGHINPHGLEQINLDFYEGGFRDKLASLDPSKAYVVYCRSGNRSAQTVAIMKQLGFKNIYHMKNGILSWQNANLPLE